MADSVQKLLAMKIRIGTTWTAVALVLAAVTAACAAPPVYVAMDDDEQSSSSTKKKKKPADEEEEEDEGGDEAEDDGTPSTPRPPGDAPTEPPPDPGPEPGPAPTGQCGGQTDPEQCFQCCAAGNEQAMEKADQAFQQCACTGVCKTACGGSFCQGGQPTAACEQCLDGADQCGAAAQQACAADPACAKIDQCLQASCPQ